MAEVDGGVVEGLSRRLRPQVQGVAATAALEAVEGVLVQVGRAAPRRCADWPHRNGPGYRFPRYGCSRFTQEVIRACDLEVTDVDMPVLVGLRSIT